MTQLRGNDLAYATLDYIREHPQEWDQSQYFCGSLACFAGRAFLLGMNLTSWQPDEDDLDTGTAAARLLGWTDWQADYVFGLMTRDYGVLERAVKEVLNGEVR